MFNVENLLGKIVGETLGGGSKKGGGLLASLSSGQGLMTIVGLGVGAYEILKDQKEKGAAPASPGMPPPPPSGKQTSVPPPVPGSAAPPSPPAMPTVPGEDSVSGQDLALRMIQVMIAAAHADGTLDGAEEKAILDRLRGAELSGEETMFLLDELHKPKTLPELTAGISDPSVAKTMYMLARTTIEVDSEAERVWLDDLGTQLGLSAELRSFLEQGA